MVLLGVTLMVLVALLVGFLARPTNEPAPRFETPDAGEVEDAAIILTVSIDSIDPASGLMKVRLSAIPGARFPDSGAELFTSLGALPSLSVSNDNITPETSADLPFLAGDIADYPFDRYRAQVEFLVVEGAGSTLVDAVQKPPLPFALVGIDNAAGFSTAGSTDSEGSVVTFDMATERKDSAVWWASAMMAIYWLLAASVVAVTLAVVLGSRLWETRHLAWLGAMIFALAGFRNAAPGTPPIGTFFDFYAFFWAEALVALSLVALVVYYLVRSRENLKL